MYFLQTHCCCDKIISQSGIIKVILFYSILFYSILFYSILFYQVRELSSGTSAQLKGIPESPKTGLKWTVLLPIALMSTRSTPIRKHKLTPHEINTGRLMAIPGNSVQCTKKMDLNPKNCYVCGFIPHSTREGLPLMALPASSCDTCHILHFNSPKEHCTCPSLSQNRLYYTAMNFVQTVIPVTLLTLSH